MTTRGNSGTRVTHIFMILITLMMISCVGTRDRLTEQAGILRSHIPDQQQLELSREYLTEDFFSILDTLFYGLPEHEAMDHEWSHYFVTSNGGKMTSPKIIDIRKTDNTHAVATLVVRQAWEDGSFDEETDLETHEMSMEKVEGIWLMSDFDNHKNDCVRHININRREQAIRNAIREHIISLASRQSAPEERCYPALHIIAEEERGDTTYVWGDFRLYWYETYGDTLRSTASSNIVGMITLVREDGSPSVIRLTEPDDRNENRRTSNVFGRYYDIFENTRDNKGLHESIRREQLREYVRKDKLNVLYYQDQGHDAIAF